MQWHCSNTAGVEVHQKEAVRCAFEDMLSLNKVPLLHFPSQKKKKDQNKGRLWCRVCRLSREVAVSTRVWWIVRTLVLVPLGAHWWAGTVWIYSSSVCNTDMEFREGEFPKRSFLLFFKGSGSWKFLYWELMPNIGLFQAGGKEALSPRALLRTVSGAKGWQSSKKGSQCYFSNATWVRASYRRDIVVENF